MRSTECSSSWDAVYGNLRLCWIFQINILMLWAPQMMLHSPPFACCLGVRWKMSRYLDTWRKQYKEQLKGHGRRIVEASSNFYAWNGCNYSVLCISWMGGAIRWVIYSALTRWVYWEAWKHLIGCDDVAGACGGRDWKGGTSLWKWSIFPLWHASTHLTSAYW